MLIVYGADLSSPSNKVRYAANALGLSYEYRKVNLMEGEHTTPDFLRLNPAGKIPVIDDDGFVLFESNAILRYLARKTGSPLYPTDPETRAVTDQWMDFASMHVAEAVGKIFFHRLVAPKIGAPPDEGAAAEGERLLRRFLPVIERRLRAARYMSGEEWTLADLALLAALDPVEAVGMDIRSFPRLVVWRDDLRRRDFYRRCHAIYGEGALSRLTS